MIGFLRYYLALDADRDTAFDTFMGMLILTTIFLRYVSFDQLGTIEKVFVVSLLLFKFIMFVLEVITEWSVFQYLKEHGFLGRG